ncbi:DUF222 domain-containing protein [Egicoccus sp. AB-alg2]|uniref:HNH endonuclease signature motif containing protein n=1 Tax=Egicoccus sp. AB-alg2 TaxID=3242693 RepID=UPI00359EC2B6
MLRTVPTPSLSAAPAGRYRAAGGAARRGARPHTVGRVLAADHGAGYSTATDGSAPATRPAPVEPVDVADGADAFPVLAEVPGLAGMLDELRLVDRLLASVLDTIIQLQDSSAVETVTGVPLEQWLLSEARRTSADRRMLLTAADVLRRLPGLKAAFDQARISWAQLRIIALEVQRLPRRLDPQLDAAVDELVDRLDRTDPDAVSGLVRWLAADLTAADTPDEPDEEPAEMLVLQPRLDGTGGKFFGQANAANFALLEAATDPGKAGPATKPGIGHDPDPKTVRQAAKDRGQRRFAKLIDLLDTAAGGQDGRAGVKVLVRIPFDTLLEAGRLPAEVLTRLAGGKLRLTSGAARRLLDERGADLRTVIVDDAGQVLGVGRARRFPPGWLSDAVLAVHDTCSEPGCHTAALACDIDHARPWRPVRPGDLPGRTDIDQLAPLCRPTNHTKDAAGWTVTQTADGIRVWHHPRSGLRIRTLPGTTRIPLPPTTVDRSASGGTDPPTPPRGGPAGGADPPAVPGGTDPPAPSGKPRIGGADPPAVPGDTPSAGCDPPAVSGLTPVVDDSGDTIPF